MPANRFEAFTQFAPPVRPPDPLRQAITRACRRPEPECLPPLLAEASLPAASREAIAATARRLIEHLRSQPRTGTVQALLQEYALSSREGVALMCLAEALLRVPDRATRDRLIRDKIAGGDWVSHLGHGRALFVNAATWGLVVTGRLTAPGDAEAIDSVLGQALTRVLARLGEPVIRTAMDAAMRTLGEQFVTGQTIAEALRHAAPREARGYRFSYDMLGEAALTAEAADAYCQAYAQAIEAIGRAARRTTPGSGVHARPGISIKLSALHPRYARAQAGRVMAELAPRVLELARLARTHQIGLNIDAEEADRLELSLDILQSLAEHPDLAGWDGLGFVVQAYAKRCPAVIDWLVALGRRTGHRIMVRLVKGAYWDSEIKHAQVEGLADFPVYTRKAHTDVAYLACARKLLDARDAVFPQFATHNAQTLATIHHLAGPRFTPGDYEFQCLHGMGEPLYDQVIDPAGLNRPCRIYGPVGTHETLLAYLVRRLLENGANSSFVNRIQDPAVTLAELIADPVEQVLAQPAPGAPHPRIALPGDLYPGRANSRGSDLADEQALAALSARLRAACNEVHEAGVPGLGRVAEPVRNPADHADLIGQVYPVDVGEAERMAEVAAGAAEAWAATPVARRADTLERAADLMQAAMPELMALAIREAGKTAADAVAEVREAVDFLRYYARQGRRQLAGARPLGPVVCISPWNFPLAIFTGQVAAALVAGNPVLAKPAEQTPLIAAMAVRLLHQAGVPAEVLQLVPGDGAIGAALVATGPTAGVLFTGSTEVARLIQGQLAGRLGPDGLPIPLIAETGGQNAMIVDSSALTEQVVADVLASAFDSAGQRCSALRVLCLQEEIAERTLAMLRGAIVELRLGSPDHLCIDVGPVISTEARDTIRAHIERMRKAGYRVDQAETGEHLSAGTYVAPCLIEIPSLDVLEREVFGPVLHVVRYRRADLDALIGQINATGYGLTFGLHTRIDAMVDRVLGRVSAGNIYVNRNIIGAVVGLQPFGGSGLSGTGPKAGGPLYLPRLSRGAATDLPEPQTTPPPALSAFADWAEGAGLADVAAVARTLGRRSRLGQSVELPGPVGESNSYSLRPRGRIAVAAGDQRGLWRLVAACLATGNVAVVMAEGPVPIRPTGFPAILADRVIWSDTLLDTLPTLAGALVAGGPEALVAISRALARRTGPIITLYTPCGEPAPTGADLPLDLLLEEVAVSINTAAAGGNASLMAGI